MKHLEDKFMRVLVMFDLPTKTKKDRHNGTKFRNNLIKLGFFMIQFSVYMRICKGIASAKTAINNIKRCVPPLGNIRCLIITEKQFDHMEIILGYETQNEKNNKEMTLFDFSEKSGEYEYMESNINHTDETIKSNQHAQEKPARKKTYQQGYFEF